MNRSTWLISVGAVIVWTGAITGAGPATPRAHQRAAAAARVDFQGQIRPIIEKRCLECHSAEKRKGGLSLAEYGDVLEGGRDGAAVIPGSSASSLIVRRLVGEIEPQMPKDEDPLTPAELALVRRWIDEGARETPASPPAPQPWVAPLALVAPDIPQIVWRAWSSPIDRFVSAYFAARQAREPTVVEDAVFARRVYLDAWGLLPPPAALQAFVKDQSPSKRERLVRTLLADNESYAAHGMSFWNDLLRNEDGVNYYNEDSPRKSITTWLRAALESNLPYDRFVEKLLNPQSPGDPEGFLAGVNWRGVTSAAVTPWMQAAQNSAQVFLGVNLKCNACHDSFISHWKLKDAYALASYFSPDAKLQLFRCDRPLKETAAPGFLYPEIAHTAASDALDARRMAIAATFTDPRNGRLARTLVNRMWQRLFGYGLVGNVDEMDGKPWDPELLDALSADFAAHGYDVKRLLLTIMTSRAYQLPAVARKGEPPARGYVFDGPELRRLTAEEFVDAIGTITGEWSVLEQRESGIFAREWRVPPSDLTRALGRPIRDQVNSTRAVAATTPQELELVNGETLTKRLSRGARRMLGELAPAPVSLFSKSIAGRTPTVGTFDLDISHARRLWLIVRDEGSSAPERNEAAWSAVQVDGPSGWQPLSSLKLVEANGLRTGAGPVRLAGAKTSRSGSGLRVASPSRLVFDLAGRRFTRLRGSVGLENGDVGATLQPQIRFFIFDAEPDLDRLMPISPGAPLPQPGAIKSSGAAIDRVFWCALSRAPSPEERALAEEALRDPARPGGVSASGLADLIWAVMMKPEFQFVR